MKKNQTARLALTMGTIMLSYGVGLVSVPAGSAAPTPPREDRPNDSGRGDEDRPPMRGPRGGGPRGGGPRDGGGRDGKMHGPHLQEQLEDLDLNVAQLTKIQTAQASERAQMEALHAQMERVQQQTRAAIDAALTAEQRQKLALAEKEMASDRGPRGSRREDHDADDCTGNGRDANGRDANGRGPNGHGPNGHGPNGHGPNGRGPRDDRDEDDFDGPPAGPPQNEMNRRPRERD